MMKQVGSLDAFIESPGLRYYVARKYAALCPSDTFSATTSWDFHETTEIRELGRVMDAFTAPGRARQRVLADAEFVTTTSPFSYTALTEYLTRSRVRLSRGIEKLAIVRPAGFPGAVLTGMCSLVPLPTVQLFDALLPALHWLQVDADSQTVKLIQDLRHPVVENKLLAHLRRLLMELARVSLPEAARRLGVSRRTLQRHLMAARTTFQTEATTAKLHHAQGLMLSSPLSLTAIACELGFASLQHFSASFRSVHGETPSSWRAGRR